MSFLTRTLVTAWSMFETTMDDKDIDSDEETVFPDLSEDDLVQLFEDIDQIVQQAVATTIAELKETGGWSEEDMEALMEYYLKYSDNDDGGGYDFDTDVSEDSEIEPKTLVDNE